jgi:hypothetical protein
MRVLIRNCCICLVASVALAMNASADSVYVVKKGGPSGTQISPGDSITTTPGSLIDIAVYLKVDSTDEAAINSAGGLFGVGVQIDRITGAAPPAGTGVLNDSDIVPAVIGDAPTFNRDADSAGFYDFFFGSPGADPIMVDAANPLLLATFTFTAGSATGANIFLVDYFNDGATLQPDYVPGGPLDVDQFRFSIAVDAGAVPLPSAAAAGLFLIGGLVLSRRRAVAA